MILWYLVAVTLLIACWVKFYSNNKWRIKLQNHVIFATNDVSYLTTIYLTNKIIYSTKKIIAVRIYLDKNLIE